MSKKAKQILFYVLNCTWGIIMTALGAIVALVLIICGYKPKRHGGCFYFEVGEGWGGFEMGLFFVYCKDGSEFGHTHEFGHGIQNCVLGPLMPFLVSIPSAIRYWYREFRRRAGNPCTNSYYDIWFERTANELGAKYLPDWQ